MKEIILKTIEKSSAEYTEIHIEKVVSNSFSISNGNIEDIQSKDNISGNIRLLKNGCWGFVAFNKIEKLNDALNEALLQAKFSSRFLKEKHRIEKFKPVIGNYRTDFKIDPLLISLKDKYNFIKKYDEIFKKHKRLENRKIYYIDRNLKSYYANSEGSYIEQDKTFTGILFQAFARDGNNIQVARENLGGYYGFEITHNHEEVVEEVAKRAIDMLKAKQIEGGRYTVLLDQRLAGVFAHEAFGHLSEADFIYENERLKNIMKIGREFGPPDLNIIDDGSISNVAGFIFVDDEGVLPQKTYLIKNGILNARLHSRETAYKMKEPLTGNARAINPFYPPIVRMTNTYIDKGNWTFEEIMNSIDDGIYAIDYLGGQTNLEMFTFSAAYAYRIKNGKKVELLKNVVLTGNVFETLRNIEMIGNDLKLFGGLGGCGKGSQSPLPVSDGAPHIKIKNVLIGGT
jgi:TldD protein